MKTLVKSLYSKEINPNLSLSPNEIRIGQKQMNFAVSRRVNGQFKFLSCLRNNQVENEESKMILNNIIHMQSQNLVYYKFDYLDL